MSWFPPSLASASPKFSMSDIETMIGTNRKLSHQILELTAVFKSNRVESRGRHDLIDSKDQSKYTKPMIHTEVSSLLELLCHFDLILGQKGMPPVFDPEKVLCPV